MTGHEINNPRLAFLVFRSRSGSTLFGDRLSRHPEVLVTPESNLAPKLIKYLGSRRVELLSARSIADHMLLETKFRQWGLSRQDLVNILQNYKLHHWASILQLICRAFRDHKKPGAKVVVIKNSGWYYKNLGFLLSVFPGSRAVSVIRDPRAVFNSARKALHSEKGKPLAWNVLSNSLGWCRYVKILEETELKHPGLICTIKYEDIVNNLPDSLNTAWKALGVRQLQRSHVSNIMFKIDGSHLVSKAAAHLHPNVLKEPMPGLTQKWRSELPRWQALLIRYVCRHGMRKYWYK